MKESKIEQDACDEVFTHLAISSLKLNVRGKRGFPDRMFLLPGRPLFVEFKRPGESTTPVQRYIHQMLRDLGYQVEVVDNAVGAFRAIIRALETTRLSKAGRDILTRARRRCAVLDSRVG